MAHNERCKNCKANVKALLEKIYGEALQNHKFEIGAKIEYYKKLPQYLAFKKIYSALQNYRGFKEFIRSKNLPHCDFFIPNKNFIVEFDESQHFTTPRKITLEHYPNTIQLGFNKEMWMNLCGKINMRDNDPPFRDEQRAWYDTLRDFLPEIKGLNPTVRLFAKDFVWCSLSPDNQLNI